MRSSTFGSLLFLDAVELWLNGRNSIGETTRRDYRECIKHLVTFFGELRLKEIHIGHLQTYQEERRKTSGPVRINREIGVVLGGTLDRAGLWEEIKKFYDPLPLSKKKRGVALEPEEEKFLWKIAASNPRWKVIYWCSVLARNTCLGTNEIRMLRLGAVDQKAFEWLRVEEGLKNDYRERTIRCNNDARWAMRQLIERAHALGAKAPAHFLLPHRSERGTRGIADVTRPQSSFLWSWRKLRAEVAKKYPHLSRLRFYDNRHTACTRLLENPEIPYNAIEHMMGHEINSRTKRIYDHVRDATLRTAADALGSGHFEMPENRVPFLVEKTGT